MKIKFLFFLSLIFLIHCSEAPIPEKETTGRVVLAELFTFARCTYCPFAEAALDSLSEEYGDSLAVIAYHRQVTGDTLSPTYVAVRESLYQIDLSPTVVFDGTHSVQTEDPKQDYAIYKGWIESERQQEPRIELNLEVGLIGSAMNTTIDIIPIDSIPDGEFRLFVVIYEDSVHFHQAGATDSIYNFVMRAMAPDEYGVPIQFAGSDTISREFNINIKPFWNHEKLGVVAFVQNMDNKEILQTVVEKSNAHIRPQHLSGKNPD